MKTFRDTFEENYVAVEVPCNNRKGFKVRYEYCGPWFMWALPAGELKKTKRSVAALCAVSLAAFCCSALWDTPLNYSGWVSLPATFAVAVMLFEVIGVVQFLLAGKKVTRITFQDIDRKLKITLPLHTLLLLIAAAACVWLCIRYGLAFSQGCLAIGYLLSALCSARSFHIYRRIYFKTEKNEVCHNCIE